MPTTFTSTFAVRYHECDGYGHVNNVNYARYMQEAAFGASAQAGYDAAWYAGHNRIFVVRGSHIEYLRPAVYGDAITITTWISDVRRVSARRQYEMRHAASGELLCRAHSDWVLLARDPASGAIGRPAALDEAMLAAFQPERTDAEAARPTVLTQPAQPGGTFRLKRNVSFQDLDSERVVNNPVYLDYTSDCGFRCTAHFGWPVGRLRAEGVAIYFRVIDIEYLQPAVMDDDLEIAAWLSDVKRITVLRHFAITRMGDGALLARVNALCVTANIETGAPTRIPTAMLADFTTNVTMG